MMYDYNFNKVKSEYGVGEWAGYSYNIGIGCEHNCLYCYAKADALKYGNITSADCWATEKINNYKTNMDAKADKRVMFPSTHDISPQYLASYVKTLENLLKAGNEVLVVTKPHFDCIKEICDKFYDYKNKLEFRFTIGTTSDIVSKFWEPGAPLPMERLKALNYAYKAGFATSVSMEPMLEGFPEALALYRTVEQKVNGTVWIGTMNKTDSRVDMSIKANKVAVDKILKLQSNSNIMKLYHELKDEPKVRWKDSIKTIIKCKSK